MQLCRVALRLEKALRCDVARPDRCACCSIVVTSVSLCGQISPSCTVSRIAGLLGLWMRCRSSQNWNASLPCTTVHGGGLGGVGAGLGLWVGGCVTVRGEGAYTPNE